MSKKIMIAGITVEYNAPGYDELAVVRMHKLGTDARMWLSPDEARRLGQALIDAANEADGDE